MLRKLVLGLALALLALPALAAGIANSIITPQTPNRGVVQFLTADSAGTYKVLYTGGASGSKCTAVWVTSSDTATHLVTLQFANVTTVIGSTLAGRGGVSVTTAASAGVTSMSVPVNALSPTNWPGLPSDSDNNPYILLTSADTLQATFATAVTASAALNLTAVCSDF